MLVVGLHCPENIAPANLTNQLPLIDNRQTSASLGNKVLSCLYDIRIGINGGIFFTFSKIRGK